jgi:REP element-mobilizing transposase RayT
MFTEKFQNKHCRKMIRVTWHDYSGGAYFITVCAKNHEHFFGEITNVSPVGTWRAASLQMTEIGQYLYDNLQNITTHYPYAEIPLFVVMPNHWHAVVFIDGNKTPYIRGNVDCGNTMCRDVARRVPTGENEIKNEHMQNIANKQGWLSVAIGGIKSAVTKFAHENDIDFAWQTRFHDRIIRNQKEMNRIADYIENNPQIWDVDCFNKNNNI